ncbi:MAG: protein kinase [Pyrinomonadaceae bacterium]
MNPKEEIQENSMVGKRIGVYELKREIGRGGMGAVYLAERADGEFRQTVAIKLIKRGMDTDAILKRFRRERQIIAALDHPNIAYFMSGGSTPDGLPYFVMEYIDGRPLYNFCDKNRIETNDRLRIFRQVCGAVEAAHRRKVIHRDLKPSNILVKPDGTPKLLDFGIAKVLDPELTDTDFDPTATALRVMTPEYASPEQISGEDVAPASDIYSLGVILYELLTGHRPYKLKRQVPHEVARIIREEIPTHLSTGNGDPETLIPTLEYISRNPDQTADPKPPIPNPESDALSRIVLKALRKDPVERYESAAELAADITNYLEGRPVRAESFSVEGRPKNPEGKRSVAILPFRIIGAENSKNTDDIFLGIGLADALVSRLSGVQRLIVRPTSSVLPFAEKDPIEAGRRTGVDFVLDGSIRRVGERIRVTVQLLEVERGASVWAEKFDENFTDVLEIEDTISERAARVLLPQLTGEERRRLEKRGTNRPEAYQAYLRGRYFANQFTDESLLKAIEAYKEAVRIDPEYSLPHVGIADFYVWSAIFGEMPCREAYPLAKEAARRALEVDDSSGEAYAILAFITLLYDWNWPEAERLVGRALELNPNYYFAHECFSNFFSTQGLFDKAVEEIGRAEELDPLSPRAKLMTSWTLYQSRNFPEAVLKAERANEMQSNFPQGFLHLGNALIEKGEIEEAIRVLTESLRGWEGAAMPGYMLCFALVADGRREKARELLDRLVATERGRYVKPYFVAMAFAALGETDEAFRWFEKAVEERNEWMIWFGTEPKLDPLRRDPRYFELLKRTNNPIIAHQKKETAKNGRAGRAERSIAVLPFRLLSSGSAGETEDEYLSIGLADALTMRLSNVRRFLVRPTSSVLPFIDRQTDSFAAGRELGVDFVVDGNIRRVGDRLRIAVQLLNVGENSTRWAERFDENHTDVLTLEDTISERVTRSLLPRLTGEDRRRLAKRGTDHPRAFEAYMRGRFFWNQFTPESFPKAIESFRKAVEIDPEYGLAYVGIADFYAWATIYGLLRPAAAYPQVLAASKRALEIDDTLGEAYATLGLYHSNHRNWAESERLYRRSIRLNPNYSHNHEWLAAVLVGTGRFEEGVREMLLAEKIDPLSLRTKTLTAWTTYQARDFEQAEAKAREIIALDPEFPQGYMQLGNVLQETGRANEAIEALRRAAELFGESPMPVYILCFALVAAGRSGEAARLAEALEDKAANVFVPPYFLGMTRLAIGETDRAFEYFRRAFEEKSPWCVWFKTEPKLERIRTDERYSELLELM